MGAERDKEVAIRTVMGATRSSLTRQFLTESLVLALLGGILGLGLTWGLVIFFKDSFQSDLPHWLTINVNMEIVFFTAGVACFTGIIAGLAPALKISGLNVHRLIKESKGTSGGNQHRLRKVLVVSELSLSIILLIGTGLLLKSLHNLQKQELGFNAENTLTYRIALPWRKYGDMQQIHPFYKNLIAEIKLLPGVKTVALNDNLPLSYEASEENRDSEFTVDGQSFTEQKENPYVKFQTISGDYFPMMEIPLLQGRYLTDYDDTLTTPVAVINKSLATKLFPKGDVLNKRIKFGKPDSESVYRTIVGIVGDVKHSELRKTEGYHIYLSCWQRPEPNQFIVIKTDGNPMDIVQSASAAVSKVDGDQSLYDLKTLQQRVDEKLWQDKIVSKLFSLFAGIAIILAAIGVYSVMSYAISQRTKEIGVRRVLGASTGEIVWMIQKEVLTLAGLSICLGMVAVVFVTRYISQFMFDVKTWETSIYIVACSFLIAIAGLAALIPAWRATLINPVNALKNE